MIPGLVAGLAVPAPAAGASTAQQRAAGTAAPSDYVALGDSYSAGTGAPGTAGLCFRSTGGYPALWAERTGARLKLAACGGATMLDLRRNQLSQLNEGTDLVTVTIGGNDAGFVPALVACGLATDDGCADLIRLARAYMRTVLAGQLDVTYAAIRDRAPNARVIVLGYPRLFEETGRCGAGYSLAKRRALNAGADHLVAVIRARATAAGFTFVDVRSAFAGHAVCADTPWIHGWSARPVTGSFHPNAAGYARGYLPALTAAVA